MSAPATILVVDDDENDSRMTREALTPLAAGLQVCAVYDGVEALDYLYRRGAFQTREPGNPEVILLDLNMPRVDGWQALRQIKSDPVLKAIPVVVFTSSARDHDVMRCYELGANAVVVKPIAFDEFTRTVRDIQAFWAGCNRPSPGAPAPTHEAGAPALSEKVTA